MTLPPALILLAPVLIGQSAPADWIRFVAPDMSFSVLLPSAPREDHQKLKTPAGTVAVSNFLVEPARYRPGLFVSHSELTEKKAPEVPEAERLKRARDGALHSTRGKLQSEKKLDLGKHPGLEMDLLLPNQQHLRTRIYVVHGRVYQMIALGTEEAVASAVTRRFLDSFRLEKK